MANVNFEQAKECVKANLMEGFGYDEACQFGRVVGDEQAALTEDAQKACDSFFDACEEGMNPFEAFVRNF